MFWIDATSDGLPFLLLPTMGAGGSSPLPTPARTAFAFFSAFLIDLFLIEFLLLFET